MWLLAWALFWAFLVSSATCFRMQPFPRYSSEQDSGSGEKHRFARGSRPFLDFVEEGPGKNDSSENEIDPKDIYPHCDGGKGSGAAPAESHIARDEQTKERIRMQTRILQLKAHKYAIFGPSEALNATEPKNSFKILALSVAAFKKLCPISVIPADYSNYMHMLFKMLHRYMTPTRNEYLTNEELTWLTKILTECEEQAIAQSFRLNGDCGDNIEADGRGVKICTDPIHQFQPKKYDLLLDTVWRIYELIHFQCFARFQGYSRVWHRYAMGIMDMFNLPMKQRWDSPLYTDYEMETLFGPSWQDYSDNIDKCVHAYSMNDKDIKNRLPRIYQSYMSRYGANVESIFQNETDPVPADGEGGGENNNY